MVHFYCIAIGFYRPNGGGCFFTLLCSPTNLRIEKGLMALILPKLWGQL